MNSVFRIRGLGLFGGASLLAIVAACTSVDVSNDGDEGVAATGGTAPGGASGTTGTTGGNGTQGGASGTTGVGGVSGTTGVSGASGTAGVGVTGGVSGTGTGGGAGGPPGGVGGTDAGGAGVATGGAAGIGMGGASTGGASGAATGGTATGGVAGKGGTGGSGNTGGGVVWPNDMSKANSDTWLQQNHDRITQLRPKVLVIDLENTNATTALNLTNAHIAALKEASSFHKYKDTQAQPMLAYELVKIVQATKGSRIDYNSWNTQTFADSNLQLKDPANPTGPNLTLCQAFEKGVLNEVWCMASSNPKCGETQEAKQAYDASGNKRANMFINVSNGDSINSLGCKVTIRVTDFNSGRGTGCHQHAMGHAWERYMDANAVPMLGAQAKRFLNWDLMTRVNAPFTNFYSACNSNSTQLTDCIVWDSQIHARSGASASRSFDIPDMSEGCGNAHFYPNTTGTYSYDANQPDPTVLTSCENYGLKNGTGGKDMTTTYNNAMTDTLYGRSSRTCPANQPACDDDCGGHGTTYLYQNFPSYNTQAKNADGSAMHNWWVYLFY